MSNDKTIRVRIEKCSMRGHWYEKHIGHEFTVYGQDNDPDYWFAGNIVCYILKSDCTVLPQIPIETNEVIKPRFKVQGDVLFERKEDGQWYGCESSYICCLLNQSEAKPSASLNERVGAWVESMKADIANSIEQQDQENVETYPLGREEGVKYALDMFHKHLAGTHDKVMDVQQAVKVLSESLTKDHDLYYSYQSNIAMAFVDEFNKESEHHGKMSAAIGVHHIANQAAINFLNNLIR